jgi:hypothetical protein
MNPKSSISSADTQLPASITPSALGSSSNALAERADSNLLLIWLPVEDANQPSCPAAAPHAAGSLQVEKQHTVLCNMSLTWCERQLAFLPHCLLLLHMLLAACKVEQQQIAS